jgi:hypothetical protein
MIENPRLTTVLMLIITISFISGLAVADKVLTSGSVISTTTSVSVQGTVNETVSLTKSTIGSTERTVLSNTYTTVNPSGLTWHSRLLMDNDKETVWVDYFRTGDLPRISWRQVFSR